MPVLTLDAGTVVHDRYRVLRAIGAGGMGAVYEAVDLRLRNSVALKRMTARGEEADRAFRHEAEMLASLRHSGLPAVIDFFADREARFLVMQFIEGEDLERHRARCGGTCEPPDVVAWAIEILLILEFLHRREPPIIHRDIKPANVKLTPKGEVVLLDFGLAKGAVDEATTTEQAPQSIYGFTRNYAPPEQQDGRGTDARSDLYALGATMYRLLTGVVPASADARVAALSNGAHDPLRRAHDVNPRLSTTLSAIVSRALAIHPAARFQHAGEMRSALASLRTVSEEGPRGLETRDARRVDAALPSHSDVGRQIDLIVQVRFVNSPRLGIEDWPGRHVPDQIEQASESVNVEYPRDPATGRKLPTRLRVRVVAPDFTIDGASDCLIEVPPDAYSKRLAFLLTPRRAGLCRVHVEVYAADMLHLGTVPIEVEAATSSIERTNWRVAHLMLGLFAHLDAATPTSSRAAVAGRTEQRAATHVAVPAAAAERGGDTLAIVPGAAVAEAPRGSRRVSRWMAIGGSLALLALVLIVAQQPALRAPGAPPAAEEIRNTPSPDLRAVPAPVLPPSESPTAGPPPGAATGPTGARGSTTGAGGSRSGAAASPPASPARAAPAPPRDAARPPASRAAPPPSSAPSAPGPPGGAQQPPPATLTLETAQARLRAAQEQAIEEGQKLEAANDLTGAAKAFERAVRLEAPDAKALLERNLARRRAEAERAYAFATTAENYRQAADARKYYAQVIALLPAEDALYRRAEAALARLRQ